MDERLATSLARVGRLMAGAIDPWWVIGSAAVALHGRDPGGIADIDVMLSVNDAEDLLEPRGILPLKLDPDPQFSSRWFARWDGTPLPTEFMAGFRLYEGGRWADVSFVTREAVSVEGETLYVPSRDELRELFECFGRGKDLQRAATL